MNAFTHLSGRRRRRITQCHTASQQHHTTNNGIIAGTFEIVDQWTIGAEKAEYVNFLHVLYERVTVHDEIQGKTVSANLLVHACMACLQHACE
jgi:hypothetical protein